MQARTPDLTVIVVTHNRCELALKTLGSALAATGGVDLEWIVVDSGSSDGTPAAIEVTYPEMTVIRMANRGFAAANNVGIRSAHGRYLLLLNPDVEIVSGTLAALVAHLDARPDVGLASVVHHGLQSELQWSIRRFPSVARSFGEALFAARWPLLRTLQEAETRPSRYAQEHTVDWLVGAFLIVRAQAVAAVGGMDERFFLYSEEVDWCYRLTRAGWEVRHLPVMTIVHHAGRRNHSDLMSQHAQSRKLFVQKHYGPARRLGVRAGLALGNAVRVIALAPVGLRSASARTRLVAERGALAVQLGISPPPRLGVSASPQATGPASGEHTHSGGAGAP